MPRGVDGRFLDPKLSARLGLVVHSPKVARNLTGSVYESGIKPCNFNGLVSEFERELGELRATFLGKGHHVRTPSASVTLTAADRGELALVGAPG